MPVIDPRGPQLVCMDLADHIAGRIASGQLKSGSRLPGERDLAAAYGIARMTACFLPGTTPDRSPRLPSQFQQGEKL